MKINVKGILLFLLTAMFMSCQQPRLPYVRGILSGVCFWDILDGDLNANKATFTYRLLPDGTCYKYRYHYRDNEKQKSVSPIDKEKGEVNIKWNLKSDSMLTIGETDYKVEKVEKEVVWLRTPNSHSIMLLKNCSTYIID